MLTKFAKSTAYFFVSKKIIEKEDEEIYSYGMELLFSAISNILIALIIMLITKTFLPSSIFLLTFIILRQYIGGYHADTHLSCNLILVVVLSIFIAIRYLIPESAISYIAISSIIISEILVLKFAPVEHPNKPINKDDMKILKKKAIIFINIVVIITLILLVLEVKMYGMYISLGALTASTAMICEIIKHGRSNKKSEIK